ncbi:alpha-amylase family glycosyl hydrolase [Fervidobacterium thailandense]|uniref:alpha-amylase family glycosyl hydrolase n=1 Tax=Fervidobacterium thailandense TaxID=1008305 RepID=UPI000B1B4881|nr:alpha-amylase family glycosyl hydrolase [Fervidobacterium thailandense]
MLGFRKNRFLGLLVLALTLSVFLSLSTACSPKPQVRLAKISVGVILPEQVVSRKTFNQILSNSLVDEIKEIKIIVKNSQGGIVYESKTQNKLNPSFEFELAPGNYQFVVEGVNNDDQVILRGSTTQTIEPARTYNITITTDFLNGFLETIVEISDEVYQRYNAAGTLTLKSATGATESVEISTFSSNTVRVTKELKPGVWEATLSITFTAKDQYTYPRQQTVSQTFYQQVLPVRTSKAKFFVYYESNQIAISQSQVLLPYIAPVQNLRASVDWQRKELTITWDHSIEGATFEVYKEIKVTDEGQEIFQYELVGRTTQKSITVQNYDVNEHSRINGVAVNAIFEGKQSGLARLEKKDFTGVLSAPYNVAGTYNTDTNVLTLSWTHDEAECTYVVYAKIGNQLEQLATTNSKTISVQDFFGNKFWNTSSFVVVAQKNGAQSSTEIPKNQLIITNLTVQTSSAVMYKLFIRSFYDAKGNDGIGDFLGVVQKVDYLKNLGIDTIWFLPFNKSESYHGYDVTDYYDVEEDYGTIEELEQMIKVLNENGIRVVMDAVFNHTSDKHPWFLDAVENTTNSRYWNYYIMTLEDKTGQANWHWKINSKGQKVWYFGLFSHTMPDLNFDDPEVRNEVKKIIDYWITMGVDGFRFDAAKHFYGWSWNDGISQSAQIAKELEVYIRSKLPNAILVSEVFDGNPSVLSQFAPMPVFNFNFMYEITGNYEGKDNLLSNSTNWVRSLTYHLPIYHFPFIDNHDLNRFVSVLIDQKYGGNVTSGTKQYLLVNALLLSLDGMPAIYYGNEIGLRGWKWSSDPWDMPVREPMQWYANQQGTGQTWWTKPIYQAKNITLGNARVDGAIYDDPNDGISVEEQTTGYTILNFFKQFINLRKQYPALALGSITIERDWKNLYVIRRTYGSQEVLVMINLDPNYQNNFTVPAGFRWVWYAFFNGNSFEFGSKNESPLSSNTNWTVNPRQIYVFVK